MKQFSKGTFSGENFQRPQMKNHLNVKFAMRNRVLLVLPNNIFDSLKYHDFEHDMGSDDIHSTQITKEIINCFLDLRLYRYGQYYTEMVVKKDKCGIRQKSNKLVLFQGL